MEYSICLLDCSNKETLWQARCLPHKSYWRGILDLSRKPTFTAACSPCEAKRYRAFCVAGYTKGGVQEKAAIRYKIRYQLFIPDL